MFTLLKCQVLLTRGGLQPVSTHMHVNLLWYKGKQENVTDASWHKFIVSKIAVLGGINSWLQWTLSSSRSPMPVQYMNPGSMQSVHRQHADIMGSGIKVYMNCTNKKWPKQLNTIKHMSCFSLF